MIRQNNMWQNTKFFTKQILHRYLRFGNISPILISGKYCEKLFISFVQTYTTLLIRYWRNGNINGIFKRNITILDRRQKRFNVPEELVAKYFVHSKSVSGERVLSELDVVAGL